MPVLLTEAQIMDVRGRIVLVAERQADELGMERVSMHSIARALGWSATALYRYFDNRDAILAAARAAAFDRLSDRLEAAMEGPGDIWSRSRAVGNAYVDFAFEQPHAYRLIFALDHHAPGQYPDLDRAHARGRANMTRYVERMVEEGKLSGDPHLLAHVFWAGLHGVISLQMAGKLGDGAPAFQTIRRDMVRRIVHSALGPQARRTA
ncbi:TetR/AcrR family transcriptional regulator [soil metagenome]